MSCIIHVSPPPGTKLKAGSSLCRVRFLWRQIVVILGLFFFKNPTYKLGRNLSLLFITGCWAVPSHKRISQQIPKSESRADHLCTASVSTKDWGSPWPEWGYVSVWLPRSNRWVREGWGHLPQEVSLARLQGEPENDHLLWLPGTNWGQQPHCFWPPHHF